MNVCRYAKAELFLLHKAIFNAVDHTTLIHDLEEFDMWDVQVRTMRRLLHAGTIDKDTAMDIIAHTDLPEQYINNLKKEVQAFEPTVA